MNNNIPKVNCTHEEISTEKIICDGDYQRKLNYARAKKIADNYNPYLFNPIKVSKRDGKYYVFDGQHTMAALKILNGNNDLDVECRVFRDLTREKEAELFSLQSGLSRAVMTIDRLRALYVAKDVDVLEFKEAVEATGITMDFTSSQANYKIVACSAAQKVYMDLGVADFQNMLRIIKEAWCGEPDSLRGEILEGMWLFYKAYRSKVDRNKAVAQFRKVSPQKIIRDGKAMPGRGKAKYAQQLVLAYNAKNRGAKLDISEVMQ